MTQPLVSVVMPSLNQARFLREAIDSVLEQDYPRLELLVMDGGSTDGSVDILESYGDRIAFVSEPDAGQSDAINRGFARLEGEVLGWLNSDDRYCPGAVASAVEALSRDPSATFVYGEGQLIDDAGEVSGPFPWTQDFDLWRLARVIDYILQPTVFVRSSAFERAGGLDADLHYGMDWDLWIRLACHGPVLRTHDVVAQTREHGSTKTATGRFDRLRELRRIMTRHGAERRPPGAVVYGLDTLRKAWPTVFGASSEAQVAAANGRWLPRCCAPIHRWIARRIERALLHGRGVYDDGLVTRRGHAAVPWAGDGGMLTVTGATLADARILPFEVRVEAAGRHGTARIEDAGKFAIEVDLPRPGGDPRVLEVVLRSSRDAPLPDGRRVSFRLGSVRLAT